MQWKLGSERETLMESETTYVKDKIRSLAEKH